MIRRFTLTLVVISGLALGGCESPPWVEPYPLGELVMRDSTYHHPGTGAPFTGPVERRFRQDTSAVEVTGFLRDGRWTGELRVYHPNGRIRYLGSLHEGMPCGEWIEEQPANDPGDWYERFVDELESLAVYEPCP